MKIERRPGTPLLPLPLVLATVGTAQHANVITIAWAGVVCSEPPMVSVAVRPARYSHELLQETRELVVNVPRASQVREVDLAGTVSGRDADKFELCGFTRQAASKVAAPLIADCPVNLECVVRHQLALGSHDLFLAEVVAVHVDDDVLDARGRIKADAVDPLSYVDGDYWTLRERVGRYGFSKRAPSKAED